MTRRAWGALSDHGNAERLEAFLAGDGPTVVFVGKLMDEKGVALLLEALERVEARAVVVGFGPARAISKPPRPAVPFSSLGPSSTATWRICGRWRT